MVALEPIHKARLLMLAAEMEDKGQAFIYPQVKALHNYLLSKDFTEPLADSEEIRHDYEKPLLGQWLGLLPHECDMLFFPHIKERTSRHTVKVIHHLVDTGEIDWSVTP